MTEKIAIFIDVENLTSWVKNDGPAQIVAEMSTIGQSIVRRAYGNWSNSHLQQLQLGLVQQGFELIYNYHPVSGKNSSDIQLTIDVMEHALRLRDVRWFVLATGNSDFSPLFRKLREIGKEVVGVGPKSPLSECVKTSCSRYIYIDLKTDTDADKERKQSTLDDAIDLAEKVFRAFGRPVPCSAIKDAMINIDSSFDEKTLGFRSFTDFLKKVDTIKLHFDPQTCVWTAHPASDSSLQGTEAVSVSSIEELVSREELYRRLLRKRNWRTVPKDVLLDVYKQVLILGPKSKTELKDILSSTTNASLTDINKALSILHKANLILTTSEDAQEEKLLRAVEKADFVRDVDIALLTRLLSALQENNMAEEPEVIRNLLYGSYDDKQLSDLIAEAKMLIKKEAVQEAIADDFVSAA
ncbi:MAG: NYN domain-containing protein [Roseiflexaceae bacterium]|nr:NYN domain-containing protein [Roseiflexaceae bacterium]